MLASDSSRQKHLGFRRNNRSVTDLALKSPVQPSRLLLIDDDRSLAALIADYCGPGGFEVTPAFSGEDGIRLAREQYFLLIILDVMLPRIDGFEVLKRIRRTSDTPILMLTTREAAKDRIHGLESGADDYLPKPFQPAELLARIHSVLRRTLPKEGPATFTLGDITVNEPERSVTLAGQQLDLTTPNTNRFNTVDTRALRRFTTGRWQQTVLFGYDYQHINQRATSIISLASAT
jgi:DNA-binding response OmpR family regulator